MKISIQSSGVPIDTELRAHAERRTIFALSRLSDRIARVDIHLRDENGPRGGVDKRCTVQVHLLNTPAAIIDEMDGDWHALIDRAMGRAGRLVSKRVDRSFGLQRGRRTAGPELARETS